MFPTRPRRGEEDGAEGEIRAAESSTVPTRREVLLANFVIARILVPHVLLRPWDVKRKPKRKTMHNCRIFATLLYRLLRRCIAGQPPGRTAEPAAPAQVCTAAALPVASGDAVHDGTLTVVPPPPSPTSGPGVGRYLCPRVRAAPVAGRPAPTALTHTAAARFARRRGSMFALGPGGADSAGTPRVPSDPLEAPVSHTLVGPPYAEGTSIPLPRPLRPIGESAAEYYRLYGIPSQYQHRSVAALQRAVGASAKRTAHGVANAAISRHVASAGEAQAENAASGGDVAAGRSDAEGKKGRGGLIGRAFAARRGRRGSNAGAGGASAEAGVDAETGDPKDRGVKLQAAATALKQARRGATIVAGRRRISSEDRGGGSDEGDDTFSTASGEGGAKDAGGEQAEQHHHAEGLDLGSAAAARIRAGRAASSVRMTVADRSTEGDHAQSAEEGEGKEEKEQPAPPEQREFVELDSSFMVRGREGVGDGAGSILSRRNAHPSPPPSTALRRRRRKCAVCCWATPTSSRTRATWPSG